MAEQHVLSEPQRLLLMAAAIHDLRPQAKLTANCGRVVWTALQWAGRLTPDVQAAWSNDFEYHPIVRDWQGVLIGLIQHEPPAEALLEGAGMFGTPAEPEALPWFTGCRLTLCGEQLADSLLAQHPEYRTGSEAEPIAAPDPAT
jgi:hypothetical protein